MKLTLVFFILTKSSKNVYGLSVTHISLVFKTNISTEKKKIKYSFYFVHSRINLKTISGDFYTISVNTNHISESQSSKTLFNNTYTKLCLFTLVIH